MSTALPTRTLNWPACYNVRDLGGLPTIDGGVTRWRAIIRSDIPARLTAAGQQALLDYSVRTILDLREPAQVVQEPSIFMTPSADAAMQTYLNLPMETRDPAASALMRAATDRAEVYCIILDHYPAQIAQIMRAIATARVGGIVLHCHAGKDRTGIITALLLSLAGVADEVIAADYAESQRCLWPLYDKLIEEVRDNSDHMGQWLKAMIAEANGDLSKISEWLKPIATVEMMYKLLNHLHARYGNVYNYLLRVGLNAAELIRIRQRLHE
jgi:protein-tyrosine phosphatase